MSRPAPEPAALADHQVKTLVDASPYRGDGGAHRRYLLELYRAAVRHCGPAMAAPERDDERSAARRALTGAAMAAVR